MTKKLIITPKKPRGEDGYKTFSIRIKDDIVDKINDLVIQTGRTRNELIGILLDFSLNNCVVKINSKTNDNNMTSITKTLLSTKNDE